MKRKVELPEECWELIFNRLGDDYRFEVISLVSKQFLSASSRLKLTLSIADPSIRFHCNLSKFFQRFHKINCIYLDLRDMSDQESNHFLLEIARSGLDLESLHVLSFKSIDMDVYRELGLNMNNLRILTLMLISDLKGSELMVIGSSMLELQQLSILRGASNVSILRDAMKVLASNFRQLRSIDVTPLRFVSDEWLMELSLNCKFLSDLVVCNNHHSCSLTEHGIGFALRHCQNLTSLNISGMMANNTSPSVPSSLFSIENSISHARALCHLCIDSMDVSDALLYSIANAHLPLKKLSLISCKNFTYSGLSFLLREYQSISHLTLRRVKFLTDQMMNDLSKFLRNVTHLQISSCSLLTDPMTFFILTGKCPNLLELGLTSLRYLGQGGNFGLELTENHSIKSLKLAHNNSLNDESLISFGLVCPNIQLLDLTGCYNITENGVGEILKSCSMLTQLHVSKLKGRIILGTGSELTELNLEVLNASEVDIDDEGMSIIALRCRGLLKLTLYSCEKVTEKGVKEVLEKCIKLREIDLCECKEMSSVVVPWMMSLRPSLRKIFTTTGQKISKEERRDLFLRHGCVVYNF